MSTKVKEAAKSAVKGVKRVIQLMTELGQVFTARYDKKELLLTIGVDDPEFVSIEQKETRDKREFFVLNFADPKDPKIKGSLPISGDESAESFEIWLTECNTSFEANGKTIAKGTKKVRCYAVEEEEEE